MLRLNKIAFCIILLLGLFPQMVFAIGFGEMKLFSYLNEPLEAEIELLGTETYDLERLLVTLASAQEFKRAGLERPFFLSQLRFEVKRVSRRTFIKISSKDSIKQPYLDFLIDLSWPGGRLVRGYTFLLDPTPVGCPTAQEERGQNGLMLEEPKAIVLSASPADRNGVTISAAKQNFETLFEEENRTEIKDHPAPSMTVVSKISPKGGIDESTQNNQSQQKEVTHQTNAQNTILPPPVNLKAPLPSVTPESVLQINFNVKQILFAIGGLTLFLSMALIIGLLMQRRKNMRATHASLAMPVFTSPMAQNPMAQTNPMAPINPMAQPNLMAQLNTMAQNPMGQINAAQLNPLGQMNPAHNSMAQNNAMVQPNTLASSLTMGNPGTNNAGMPSSADLLPALLQLANMNNALNNNNNLGNQFSEQHRAELHKLVGSISNMNANLGGNAVSTDSNIGSNPVPNVSSHSGSNVGSNSEMSLKLELARYYLDLGDMENARPLIEAILQEGNGQEKETAESMLNAMTQNIVAQNEH